VLDGLVFFVAIRISGATDLVASTWQILFQGHHNIFHIYVPLRHYTILWGPGSASWLLPGKDKGSRVLVGGMTCRRRPLMLTNMCLVAIYDALAHVDRYDYSTVNWTPLRRLRLAKRRVRSLARGGVTRPRRRLM
jgi:hypothetical protein